MRAFFQKKAGATYFAGSTVTVNIRKHNLEFIFALNGGWHAVVSVVPGDQGLMIMAGLGEIVEEVDKIFKTLSLKPGEHLQFGEILEGKSEYRLITMDVDGKDMTSGICKVIKGKELPHLQILGDKEVLIEAEKLLNLVLSIYSDLQKSTYPSLKALTKFFHDRKLADFNIF